MIKKILIYMYNTFAADVELCGPKHRAVVGIFSHTWFSLGFMFLPLVAYFFRDFTQLQLVLAAPISLSALFIW